MIAAQMTKVQKSGLKDKQVNKLEALKEFRPSVHGKLRKQRIISHKNEGKINVSQASISQVFLHQNSLINLCLKLEYKYR